MSVEIPMYPVTTPPPATGEVNDDAMVTPLPPANVQPVHVLISPILPVPVADGASAAAAAATSSLTPAAYTGVLYLDPRSWEAAVGRVNDPHKKRERWLREMRGWLMVLAVLAASVTYQAGLNPPGGFWQDSNDGHVAGTPVLESTFAKRYTVFFYFNATAFVTSVVTIILLMNESFYHSEAKVEALEVIVVLDMAGLMGAYIAGSTRLVSSSIYIIVLAVVVFLYVVYTARFLPKLWKLVLNVPCVDQAAQHGALPVPRYVLDERRQQIHLDHAQSAPPP
ncbi:hypothetical protein EJB05_55681, partial [Eragrostis curvula]